MFCTQKTLNLIKIWSISIVNYNYYSQCRNLILISLQADVVKSLHSHENKRAAQVGVQHISPNICVTFSVINDCAICTSTCFSSFFTALSSFAWLTFMAHFTTLHLQKRPLFTSMCASLETSRVRFFPASTCTSCFSCSWVLEIYSRPEAVRFSCAAVEYNEIIGLADSE